MSVEINVLGLRDLKPSLGWVPVNKAYIMFDLSSLQMPGEGLSVRNIQTQPGEPGSSPNLNVIIKFKCCIPVDPLFSPALSVTSNQCSVFDYLFMGLSQPLLGSFSINLGEIFHKKKARASGFNLLGQALNRVREAAQSETESTVPSLFPQSDLTVQSDFDTKSLKLPSHSAGSGVVRECQLRMKKELTYSEAVLGAVVLLPIYRKNPKNGKWREENPPDDRYYMQLGYDRVIGSDKPEDHIMHYRYALKTPLEDSTFFDKSPFDHFPIVRGQQVGVDSYFDLAAPQSTLETVGQFKGLIRIDRAQDVEDRRIRAEKKRKQGECAVAQLKSAGDFNRIWKSYTKDMDELAQADADSEFDDIAKQLLTQTRVLVRVYIIDAFGLAQKDTGSQSDPYVRIKLGSKVWYDEKENYQLDNPDPKINKMFELETSLPGVSLLKIQFWDYDDILSDDKIGQTAIDLEDRFFSNKWKRMKEKPIETRPLNIKTTKVPQGGVRLWLEIVPIEKKAELIYRDISPRPPAEFEARLIVWGTEDVANFDAEGTSDIFIRARINDQPVKETDTHFRCMNGQGSFNYRMKFPITIPSKDRFDVVIQIWDRDVLSKNDFIADVTFSFDETAKLAWETAGRVKRTSHGSSSYSKDSDKFWVDCMRRDSDGKLSPGGRVQVSLEVVPKDQAVSCPVGEGRNEPNVDPFLPPPVGRFEWSMNPCALIQQTIGPAYQRKAALFCCLILCVLLCAIMLPMLLSTFIANAFFAIV